ncbi:ABC transporter ATP-binding protein [Mycena kentingensis (nom. inval.)]|nr:ABC transporter ATP-binding protein [Mycena kentingensis (nom. inval.)]
MVKLLMRLYEPSSGEILLGATPTARDIRQYRVMDLRRATAALMQGHHLLPLSIAENIGMGDPEKGVEKRKDGTDTALERAPGLQWGMITRTFMRFTTNTVKLVSVDEPSSNLDPERELQLFDNLRLAREGKTMVFVTHRCMKDGRITEKGTHDEPTQINGEYAKMMYRVQAEEFE